MLILLVILMLLPPLLFLVAGIKELRTRGPIRFQFGLPELLVLPLACMPVTFLSLHGDWPLVAGLAYYQAAGAFFGWSAYYDPNGHGGWPNALGLLSGAFFAMMAFAFWLILVACGIAMVFGS